MFMLNTPHLHASTTDPYSVALSPEQSGFLNFTFPTTYTSFLNCTVHIGYKIHTPAAGKANNSAENKNYPQNKLSKKKN